MMTKNNNSIEVLISSGFFFFVFLVGLAIAWDAFGIYGILTMFLASVVIGTLSYLVGRDH